MGRLQRGRRVRGSGVQGVRRCKGEPSGRSLGHEPAQQRGRTHGKRCKRASAPLGGASLEPDQRSNWFRRWDGSKVEVPGAGLSFEVKLLHNKVGKSRFTWKMESHLHRTWFRPADPNNISFFTRESCSVETRNDPGIPVKLISAAK